MIGFALGNYLSIPNAILRENRQFYLKERTLHWTSLSFLTTKGLWFSVNVFLSFFLWAFPDASREYLRTEWKELIELVIEINGTYGMIHAGGPQTGLQ